MSHTHKVLYPWGRSIVTNQCPLCLKVVSTVPNARTHIAKQRMHVLDTKSYRSTPVQLIDLQSVTCPFCGEKFHSLAGYNVHVPVHLPSHWFERFECTGVKTWVGPGPKEGAQVDCGEGGSKRLAKAVRRCHEASTTL